MNIKFVKIDHIQLTIPPGTEDEARKFYSGLLGLQEIEKPDSLKASGGVWFKIGNIELHLGVENPNTLLPDEEDAPIPSPLRRDRVGFSKRHPGFEIENIDEVKNYISGKGVKIKEEIPIPGRKRFSLYDPFGNRIELLEYFVE